MTLCGGLLVIIHIVHSRATETKKDFYALLAEELTYNTYSVQRATGRQGCMSLSTDTSPTLATGTGVPRGGA